LTQPAIDEPADSAPPARRPRRFLGVLWSAALMTLAFPPVDWGWLAWVGLAPLFWALPRARRPHHAFALGYLFGIVHWGATITWIGTTVAAWTHSPVGWVAWILLTLIKSLWFALFGVLAWWIGLRMDRNQRARLFLRPAAIAAAWTLVEWLRGQSSVAMPWSLSGYTQYRYLPLIQAADIAGLYIVTFALAWTSAAIVEVLVSMGKRLNGSTDLAVTSAVRVLALPLLLVAAMLAYGAWAVRRPYEGDSYRVAVMQPNVASKRGDPYRLEEDLARYRRMAGRVPAGAVDLMVWPESTVSEFVKEPESVQAFGELARETGAFQLLGSSFVDPEGRVYNSAMRIGQDGRLADRYDKNWLVPMGEYVVMRPLLQHFDSVFHFPPDTIAGRQDRVMSAGRAKLCVLICYESVFPIVSRTRSRLGANLLVGITNDSWAGESSELQQHIAMVAFRAVENRRWLASAATTGITGLIEPTGQIHAVPPYREDMMVGTVRLRDEVTIYARFGDWLVALCGLMVGAVLFGGKRARKVEGSS
jgi:apolipoprotein N-acyltransferase